MSQNAFLKPVEFYQRKINPIKHYVDQNAYYLNKMTDVPYENCRNYIVNCIKQKKFINAKDPIVTFFERQENLDVEISTISLSKYISSVVQDELILAPTFTCYLPTKKIESLQVGFTDTNVKLRSVAKKASQKAEQDGDHLTYINKHNEQANKKMYNNSLSGAFVAKGSIFNNPTAHNTLTSITRTVSSLGNATNEKIIMGNRHYRNADVTLSNVISICALTDLNALEETIKQFNLVYPTIEDVVECIKYSTDVYWRDEIAFQDIREFIYKLSPIERAAVVYVSDLYHIRKHNPEFVRQLLTEFSIKVKGIVIDDAIPKLYKTDEAVVNFAHQICLSEAKGIGKDYAKTSYENVCTILATCNNIISVTEKYKSFFDNIFLTDNMPVSTAYLPDMVRRSVVLSDTDSTMFSVDDYINWYFGKLTFSEESFAVAGTIVYIATQSISHVLAMLSANLGVERKKIFALSMKPEFVFPVFAQTSVAKHYYTMILVKEGNVYSKMKMEIKGVHLKSSASPPDLIKGAQDHMQTILTDIMDGKQLSLMEKLKRVANIERRITESLLSGKTDYFKKSKVKLPEAYSSDIPEKTPYLWHMFWEQVMTEKYGATALPPYSSIKIPTVMDNPSKLKEWVENIQDEQIRDKFKSFLTNYSKRQLPTIYLPLAYVESFGIPPEIVSAIDVKKILLDLTNVERIVLESLGYFPKKGMTISELGY